MLFGEGIIMVYNFFYSKNENEIRNYILKQHRKGNKLKAIKYENATVLPRKQIGSIPYKGRGGVVDSAGEFIPESGDYDIFHPDRVDIPLSEYAYGGGYAFGNSLYRNEDVVYCGGCHLHWGHFLIETVQRCWYVIQGHRELKLVFSSYEQNKEYTWKENFSSFFRLLDIPDERIEVIHEPTTFRSVIIPEQSMLPGEWWTDEYKSIFNYISMSVDNMKLKINPYEKIYFSRILFGAASKREIGEKAIQDSFEKNGFKVLYPEKLRLEEMVYYMHTANTVACISGTITHNILFCGNNKLKWINLNKSHFPLVYQYTINDMVENGVMVHIDVYNEPIHGFPVSLGPGPFWYKITDELKKFFDDFGMINPEYESDWLYIFIYLKMCGKIKLSRIKGKLISIVKNDKRKRSICSSKTVQQRRRKKS